MTYTDSPEFQPVEFAFSKIKENFRHQYPWNDGINTVVEFAIQSVTSDNIKAFSKHSQSNLYKCLNTKIDY